MVLPGTTSSQHGNIYCMLVMLLAGEPVYGVDAGSNCSLLTNLSHQYTSTQHGTAGYH